MDSPQYSIVIPAYNESARIGHDEIAMDGGAGHDFPPPRSVS